LGLPNVSNHFELKCILHETIKLLKMKTPATNLTFLILLITSILFVSCEKDEFYELEINDKNPVIEKSINGIDFKFCLLNENGVPVTMFNEYENITFQFSITNKTGNDIYYDESVINSDGFYEIMDKTISYGAPFKKPVFFNLRMPTPIGNGVVTGINIKWIPEEEEWNLGLANFLKAETNPLQKGIYYTEFSHEFDFDSVKTEKLKFRINFEIK